jgi:hypothetical protein
MDELGGFEPVDTTGFIQIESIRIKKWVSTFLDLNIWPRTNLFVDGLSPISRKGRLVLSLRTCTGRESEKL